MNLRDKFLNSLTRYLAVNESNNLPNTSTTTQAKTKPNALKSYDEYERSHEGYPVEYNITGNMQSTSSTIPLSDYDDLLPEERMFDLNLTAPQTDANFTSIVSAEAPMSNNTQQGVDEETLEKFIIGAPPEFLEGLNLTADENSNLYLKYLTGFKPPIFVDSTNPMNSSTVLTYYSLTTSRRIAEVINQSVRLYPEASLPLFTAQATDPVVPCPAIVGKKYAIYIIDPKSSPDKMRFPVAATNQNVTNSTTAGNFGMRAVKPLATQKLFLQQKIKGIYGNINIFLYNPNGNKKIKAESIDESELIKSFAELNEVVLNRTITQPEEIPIFVYERATNFAMQSFLKSVNDTNIPTFTSMNKAAFYIRSDYFPKEFPTLHLDANYCPDGRQTKITKLILHARESSPYLPISHFYSNPNRTNEYGASYDVEQQNRRYMMTLYFQRPNNTYAFVDVTFNREGLTIIARDGSLDAITPTNIFCKYAKFFNQKKYYTVTIAPLPLLPVDSNTMQFIVQRQGKNPKMVCQVNADLLPIGMKLHGIVPENENPDPNAKPTIFSNVLSKFMTTAYWDELYTDDGYPDSNQAVAAPEMHDPSDVPSLVPVSAPTPKPTLRGA